MPTGYTAILSEQDISFADFARRCARAFGACIMQRDDPMDAPLVKPETPTYSSKRIVEAADKIKSAITMTDETADALAREEYADAMASYVKRKAEKETLRSRYERMLSEAREWDPPTPEHERLRKFMVEQIETSMRVDLYEPDEPTLKTANVYRAQLLANAQRDLDYHTKERDAEMRRHRERCEWIDALELSLAQKGE